MDKIKYNNCGNHADFKDYIKGFLHGAAITICILGLIFLLVTWPK